MKALIVYYSYSGNTERIAQYLSEYLGLKGYDVKLLKIEALDETAFFLLQAARAAFHRRARIEATDVILSEYDLICFGSPVWATGPAPAMNAYLAGLSGMENKQAIVFVTYGSGLGVNRCLNYMREALNSKMVKPASSFAVQQNDIVNKDLVQKVIAESIGL